MIIKIIIFFIIFCILFLSIGYIIIKKQYISTVLFNLLSKLPINLLKNLYMFQSTQLSKNNYESNISNNNINNQEIKYENIPLTSKPLIPVIPLTSKPLTSNPSTSIPITSKPYIDNYTQQFLDAYKLPEFDEKQFLAGVGSSIGSEILLSEKFSKMIVRIGKTVMNTSSKKIALKISESIVRSTNKITIKLLSKLGKELLNKLGIKMATQIATKLAIKAGVAATRVGAKAAALGAAGPAGWALQAATIGFDIISIGLDSGDAGGYAKTGSLKTYIDIKNEINEELKKNYINTNSNEIKNTTNDLNSINEKLKDNTISEDNKNEYLKTKKKLESKILILTTYKPFIVGPLDSDDNIDKINNIFKSKINDLINNNVIELGKSDIFINFIKNNNEDKAREYILLQNDIYINNIDYDKIYEDIYINECISKNGKIVINDFGDKQCTYKDKNTCESTYNWPIEDEQTYVEYKDDIYGGSCVTQSGLLRSLCEQNNIPYNSKTGLCDINENYCKIKGMDWLYNKDIGQNDCMINDAQKAAEMIFGETITRGLKQVFDPEQYEKCNDNEIDGGNLANDPTFKTSIDVIMGLSIASGPANPLFFFAIVYFSLQNKLCLKKTNSCNEGEELDGLMCYPNCMDLANQKGLITKEEYSKWQKDKSVKNEIYKSNGITMCIRRYNNWDDMNNPSFVQSGNDHLSLYKVSKNINASCPNEWHKSTDTMCIENCRPGYTESAGVCWKNVDETKYVNVGALIREKCKDGFTDVAGLCWNNNKRYGRGAGREPNKGPCDSGQRDDGTSCWEDLKCETKDNGYYNTSWGSVNCTDGRPFSFKGYDDCYKTWISKLETTCSGCGCIKKNLFDRQSCNNDEERNGAFCYPKCRSGYKAEGCCLCVPNEESYIQKTITRESYVPSSKIAEICPSGYRNIAGICWPDCPDKSTDVGGMCTRDTFDRGGGHTPFTMRIKKRIVDFSSKNN